MRIDFRYEYRIVCKYNQQVGGNFYIIQTRSWWRPWWKTLSGYELFSLNELCRYDFVTPTEAYPSERMAKEMADLYARNGRMAFVKSPIVRSIKNLGKLP